MYVMQIFLNYVRVTTDAAITGDSEHVAANTDALKTDEPVKVPIPQYDEEKVEK